MAWTYAYCSNITGTPIFSNNATDVNHTYYNCKNLPAGIIYMRSNNITDVNGCFGLKNNSRMYNIYAYRNTTTWNTLLTNNTSSIVGANITWTNYSNGSCYNKTYNIYILPL
jgi:hypothetical protein